jgi:hypothetical protein
MFLVVANVVLNSLILSTLIIEKILSSETSVLTRAERSHIPEDGIQLYVVCEDTDFSIFHTKP